MPHARIRSPDKLSKRQTLYSVWRFLFLVLPIWVIRKEKLYFFHFFDKISPFEIDIYLRQEKAGQV